MVESRNSKDDIKLKSRGEEGEMLGAIGKAIPDRYKGSRNEGKGGPNIKLKERVKISRGEGYGRLSLRCVNGLTIECELRS